MSAVCCKVTKINPSINLLLGPSHRDADQSTCELSTGLNLGGQGERRDETLHSSSVTCTWSAPNSAQGLRRQREAQNHWPVSRETAQSISKCSTQMRYLLLHPCRDRAGALVLPCCSLRTQIPPAQTLVAAACMSDGVFEGQTTCKHKRNDSKIVLQYDSMTGATGFTVALVSDTEFRTRKMVRSSSVLSAKMPTTEHEAGSYTPVYASSSEVLRIAPPRKLCSSSSLLLRHRESSSCDVSMFST